MATCLAITRPQALVVALAVAAAVAVGKIAGLWRLLVATSFAASVLRNSIPAPESFWYAAQFGPIVAATLITLLGRKSKTKPRPSDRWIAATLALFVGAAALSGISGVLPSVSLPQVALLAVVVAFLLATYLRRWVGQEVVTGDLALVFTLGSVTSLAGLAAYTLGYAPAIADYGRFQGLLTNANYAGMVAAITIGVGVTSVPTRKHLILTLAGIGVSSAALVLSGSRGALLAIVVALVAVALSKAQRKSVIPIAFFGSIAAIVTFALRPSIVGDLTEAFGRNQQASDITSGRAEIYADLINNWTQAPLLGTGYRTTEVISRDGAAGHNIYLSVLTETGVVGALIVLALLIAVVAGSPRHGSSALVKGAVIVVAVMELTESSILGWGGPTALIAWLVVLALPALGREQGQTPKAPDLSAKRQKGRVLVSR